MKNDPQAEDATSIIRQALADAVVDEAAITRVPPSQYCVLRAGSQAPEIMFASDDDQAWSQLQRQVRNGGIKGAYLYKMVGAEIFEPSSRRLSPEEVRAGEAVPTAPNIKVVKDEK